ncbi:fibrinogen C domain-containing protein 1-A-like isoform X2 [Drosophila innubila]|nr:fibrinogen C domain-containing protein 1-A-like isoform X2 [Drosophila innubila]
MDALDRHVKLIDGVVKAIDIQDYQEKLAEVLLMASDIKLLKTEQERQLKLIDGLDKESEIHILRAELEQQRKLIDELVKSSDQCKSRSQPRSCAGAKSNGINQILLPNFSSQPFKVICDAETRGGGWTIILRRMDGSVNFYRNWTEYKNGFGNLDGEFFIGLDKLHALTSESRQELLVLLEDFGGDKRFEIYDELAIGNEDQQYKLHTVGKASGTAGDSLSLHHGMKFTTFDHDNDIWKEGNCARQYNGAWWYQYCHQSHLTGRYNDNEYGKGVIWDSFRGLKYSLKKTIMMIRPQK